MTVSEKLSAKLEKIKQFIIEKQRLPDENSDDFEERLLYSSYRSVISVNAAAQDECEALLPEELRSVRKELQKRSTLTRDELIKKEVEQLHSRLFNDINSLADADPLGLLNDDGADDTYVVEHEYWRDTEHYSVLSSSGLLLISMRSSVCSKRVTTRPEKLLAAVMKSTLNRASSLSSMAS